MNNNLNLLQSLEKRYDTNMNLLIRGNVAMALELPDREATILSRIVPKLWKDCGKARRYSSVLAIGLIYRIYP